MEVIITMNKKEFDEYCVEKFVRVNGSIRELCDCLYEACVPVDTEPLEYRILNQAALLRAMQLVSWIFNSLPTNRLSEAPDAG